MASEDKSFADLVAEAPEARAEGTVNLVGALAKSREAGKFVLTLQDGRTVTLETSAVKGHTVLGSSLGRAIVQIEIEASKAPRFRPRRFGRSAISSLSRNTGVWDQLGYGEGDDTPPFTSEKVPADETPPFTSEKNPNDETLPIEDTDPIAEGLKNPDGEGTGAGETDRSKADGTTDPIDDGTTDPTADGTTDPTVDGAGTGSFEFIPPFALATPHQAPPHVVRALQARAGYTRRLGGQGWARGALHRKPVLDNAKVLQDSHGTGYWGDMTMGPADIW